MIYIYGSRRPVAKTVRYVGKLSRLVQRDQEHLPEFVPCNRRAYFRNHFPGHPAIPLLPTPRGTTCLLQFLNRGLRPSSVFPDQADEVSWCLRELHRTDLFIHTGCGPTNSEESFE